MRASKQITEGRRQCLSSEYRVLDPTNKALKLIEENVCSERAAAVATGVCRNSITAAKKAIKNGRPIGRNGNPPVFEPHEEIEFYYYLLSTLEDGRYYTNDQLRNEVRIPDGKTFVSNPLL